MTITRTTHTTWTVDGTNLMIEVYYAGDDNTPTWAVIDLSRKDSGRHTRFDSWVKATKYAEEVV